MTAATPEAHMGKRTDFGHGLHADTEAAERFHSLPPDERDRVIHEFRAAFKDVFGSVEEYVAEKRRGAASED